MQVAALQRKAGSVDPLSTAFLLAALGFAVLNGVNDGGALVAASLKGLRLRPVVAIGVLALALGVVPAVLGAAVAGTLTEGLVTGEARERQAVLAVGLAGAMVTVGWLNVRGLPTSLTLALVGGIVGAGAGAGLPIGWGQVGVTAAAGAAAPTLGGVLGAFLRRSGWLGRRGWLGTVRDVDPEGHSRAVGRAHAAAFTAQAVAYAANDGQKAYAMLAAGTLVTVGAGQPPPPWMLLTVPALFAVGAAVGVRGARSTLAGGGVLRTRRGDEVAASASSAVAVLGSSAFGAPVSMTQAVAGSLVGTGMLRGRRRVRWRAAARLGFAWVLTLPTSAATAAAIAALFGR